MDNDEVTENKIRAAMTALAAVSTDIPRAPLRMRLTLALAVLRGEAVVTGCMFIGDQFVARRPGNMRFICNTVIRP